MVCYGYWDAQGLAKSMGAHIKVGGHLDQFDLVVVVCWLWLMALVMAFGLWDGSCTFENMLRLLTDEAACVREDAMWHFTAVWMCVLHPDRRHACKYACSHVFTIEGSAGTLPASSEVEPSRPCISLRQASPQHSPSSTTPTNLDHLIARLTDSGTCLPPRPLPTLSTLPAPTAQNYKEAGDSGGSSSSAAPKGQAGSQEGRAQR